MLSPKKTIHSPWSSLFFLIGVVLLLIIQIIWLRADYKLTYAKFVADASDAFDQARQKEQTYRIPLAAIVNPGALTIQSCGTEEVRIIRKCPVPDTIVYNNATGRSVESFINMAFSELREHIVPLNIFCLADLYAGALHDKDMPISFVIERINTKTGNVLETSLLSGNKEEDISSAYLIYSPISETESLRVHLQFTTGMVFRRMNTVLMCTTFLLVIILLCFGLSRYLYRRALLHAIPGEPLAPRSGAAVETDDVSVEKTVLPPPPVTNPVTGFQLGKYSFAPSKNELNGLGESVQLNKKENALLLALCTHLGDVVDRNALLEEHWGSSGFIYSRSLDTYITKLRNYLKHDPEVQIVTIKSVGYKLVINK